MTREERDKLYDWLENGRVDVFLRRLMKERLEELEEAVKTLGGMAFTSHGADAIAAAWSTLGYTRPSRRHGERFSEADIDEISRKLGIVTLPPEDDVWPEGSCVD